MADALYAMRVHTSDMPHKKRFHDVYTNPSNSPASEREAHLERKKAYATTRKQSTRNKRLKDIAETPKKTLANRYNATKKKIKMFGAYF